MTVNLSNYKKPEGCFRITRYSDENSELAFEEIHSDPNTLMAVAFKHNKDSFVSLPEETKIILKYSDHLELLGDDQLQQSTKLELSNVPAQELQIMENFIEEIKNIYAERAALPIGQWFNPPKI